VIGLGLSDELVNDARLSDEIGITTRFLMAKTRKGSALQCYYKKILRVYDRCLGDKTKDGVKKSSSPTGSVFLRIHGSDT